MKMNLYIDFDGVILNTIELSYKEIKEKYGPNATSKDSEKFYKSLDWNIFLHECSPINNSIENIRKLIDSNLYDVAILTHVLSANEQLAKQEYLNEFLKGVELIPVTKPTPKWTIVDCQNAILVDDYSENLKEWQEHGGIPIKFSEKNKEYEFITIKSLDELIGLYSKLSTQHINKLTKKYWYIKNQYFF